MEDEKKLCFSVIGSKIEVPDGESTYFGNSNTYVSWGSDNKYPQFLRQLYKDSATLKSVIDGTANFILGEEIILNGVDRFKDAVNGNGDTMYDLMGQIISDYLTVNAFAVEVIYNKLGVISELYALDVTRCRLSSDRKKVYYCKKQWGNYTQKFDEYDAFNPNSVDVSKPQIYFYRGFAKTIYPLPFWCGAIRDVMSEISASKYVLNSMSNGLAAKTVISLPDDGNLSEKDKDAVEKAMKTKFCGPDAESAFFLFWQTGNKQIKVDSIQVQDESDKFESIKKAARENIFVSFNATPNLFGLPTETTGFNQQEYDGAYALYKKIRINPARRHITKAFDKIFGKKASITFVDSIDYNKEEEE